MEYKYYNQFNLTTQLAKSISSIISEKENEDYICKIITITIPEHQGLVFHSPLTNEEICRPGALALSGAQIQAINKEYGKYVIGTIPAADYSFLVVIKNDAYEAFSQLSFKSKDEIVKALNFFSVISEEYNGIFNAQTLIQTFPYLQEFFASLDEWRAENARVTIDNSVLEKGMRRTLRITKQ